jgi:hypothetical protein
MHATHEGIAVRPADPACKELASIPTLAPTVTKLFDWPTQFTPVASLADQEGHSELPPVSSSSVRLT